jgi:SAM-dependent methyltransferase
MTKCIFCKWQVEKIIDFWNFPYSCWVSEKYEDLKYDFQIGICKDCWLIQQINIPDPDILYSITSHEWVWKTWEWHYLASADFVLKNLNEKKKNLILEIWWWSWKIINNIVDKDFIKQIIVVDFKYRWRNNSKLLIENWLFEDVDLSKYNSKIALIYSSHVFEHISDFSRHLKKCYDLLSNNWKLIITLPNFNFWIENTFLNAFVQEHNIYPTEENMKDILLSNGFKIENIKYYWNHSVYISCSKSKNASWISNIYNLNIQKLINYKQNLENLLEDYSKKLVNKKYYIWWAHIFSQILLFSKKLNLKNCLWIFDNSIFKQWKCLYWTNFKVFSPDKIANFRGGE